MRGSCVRGQRCQFRHDVEDEILEMKYKKFLRQKARDDDFEENQESNELDYGL
eukprot:TRINITY_DN1856_c0_g2_i2.p1 TRINITY_DN1856_c0_g2~~TRINITY_DN1856_c0_g2_i2.p1  ORF type:complete len:53 (-),score=11.37 TRINITY_DN1856_c0_g2_i2:224-382(-)